MPSVIIQKNLTASGALTPPATPQTMIFGVSVDLAGTVVIKDGGNVERLRLVFGSPTVVMFPGQGIMCQNGANVTLTGVTNCGIFYGA